jgi:hypothetical protein
MPETQKVSKIPKAAKQPTDRKPKQAEDPPTYEFDYDGVTYALPPPDAAVARLPGQVLRDAYMDGDEGEMRMGFAMLENSDADPTVLAALYAMPAPEMLNHLQKWMELRASVVGATVGESLRSSS